MINKCTRFANSMRHFITKEGKCDYFVTTPIFYVNSTPHIGHLHTVLVADALHRFKQLLGYRSTIFSTGTDEHGTKIQQAANATNISLSEFCDNISSKYTDLFKMCGISYTDFIRTTDVKHKSAVQHFWKTLVSNGHISPGTYEGWYCEADESFLTESQLKIVLEKGKEIKVSAESGRPVQWVEEENFKFHLPHFHNDLLYWLKSEDVVQPKHFHKLLFTWINDGLTSHDVSVSRPNSRVHWGIPVPGNENQTIYVWLDALVNYLTVAGYPNLIMWPPDVQVIGKDILKFHGIYWPAFLMANNLEPPRCLMVHSHWTVEGEKMSKSLGNVICPVDRIQKYSASGLRYFLLREATPHNDSNYSDIKVIRVLNSELADTLGNLLNRCCGTAINKSQNYPPFIQEDFDAYCKESASDLVVAVNRLQDELGHHYSDLNFYRGIAAIMSTLREANRFFEMSKPWELKKSAKSQRHLACVLHLTMEALRICGIGFQPIVPDIADTLLTKLSVPKRNRSWEDMLPSWDRDSISSVPLGTEKVVLYQKLLPTKRKAEQLLF